jgi:acetylornithine/succinyldiaminopimelate/putrescine aminotransferase
MAPGSGAPFGSPQGEPGVALLRADWTPHAKAMTLAQEDIRRQGLLMVLDESATGFRLEGGGARQAFGLEPDLVMYGSQLAAGLDFAILAGTGEPPSPQAKEPKSEALSMAAGIIARAARPETQERLAALGRALVIGLNYFCAKAGLGDEVRWEGPLAMPRLDGRRIWAFMELAKEEGLSLGPVVMPDPALDPEEAAGLVWPRLARAAARLKVLPEGEKAPLGWRDAAQVSSCRQVTQILESLD